MKNSNSMKEMPTGIINSRKERWHVDPAPLREEKCVGTKIIAGAKTGKKIVQTNTRHPGSGTVKGTAANQTAIMQVNLQLITGQAAVPTGGAAIPQIATVDEDGQ